MKSIKYIGLVLLAAALLFVSCKDNNESMATQFGPDTEIITVGPEGAIQSVNIAAVEPWVASTDQAWILISPANGNASRECRIRVDSTFQDVMRDGEVRFASAGQIRTVKVNQMGFSKQIVVEGSENGVYEVALPDYAAYGTTHFDVNVTTNVNFNVQIEDRTITPDDAQNVDGVTRADYPTATWLKNNDYKLDLVQSKPRTVKIRFNWDYNTKWWKQNAVIRFVPTETVELAQHDVVDVLQTEAPKITDDRAGDSIAILAIARQLNMYGGNFDPSKSMLDWGEDVELYNKSAGLDKNGKPLAGRVKYIRFYFFDTEAGIPFEARYLTRAEEVVFYGNVNNHIKNIKIGTSLVELAKYGYLKKLTIDAYGIRELPTEFVQLGSTLEKLSLGSNGFLEIPSILTQENFPHLKSLALGANRLEQVYDLSNSSIEKPGLGGAIPRRIFEWVNLEELLLSYNYFEGSIPDMKDYSVRWTQEDGYPTLVGKPKVLPNIKMLSLNLNRLSGELPEWLLNHPNIVKWEPYTLLFGQEGKDSKGKNAIFTNVPDKLTPPVKE